MGRRNRLVVGALAGVTALGLGGLSAAVGDVADEGTVGGPMHADMYPSGVETTYDGGVVIADTGNNQVAKYDAQGQQVWRVGSYGAGTLEFDNPRDVGVDEDDNVYVADTRNSRVVKLSRTGQWLGATDGVGGPSTRTYSFPLGVSVQGDKVYVGDTGRHRVVVTDLAGAVVQEVVAQAGTPCATINDLRDAQADSDGNIYVAGYKTNQIVKFDAEGDCLLAWGATGSAAGRFRTPYGVDLATDPVTGRELVYVADGLNNRTQVFERDGAYVTQFGTFGEPDVEGTFTTLRRVAVAKDGSGDVWGADLWGNRIERWNRTATGFSYDRTIGRVLPEPMSEAVFHEPRGMAFLPNGDLVVADTVHHAIQRFGADGSYLSTCGERAAEGSKLGQFNWPRGIAVDPSTGNMWLADTKQHQVQVLTQSCEGIGLVRNVNAGSDTRSFNWPYDITIRPSDRFAFVVDTQNHRIKAYDVAAAEFGSDNKGPLPTHVFGTRGSGATNFKWPSGITTGPDGSVYVADRGNDRVSRFTYSAASGFTFVRSYAANDTLNGPEGVAVDSQGRIYIADSADDQVVVLAADGATTVETISALHHPANVELAPNGLLYVSDTYADVIRVYDLDGTSAPDTTPPVGFVATPTPNESFAPGAVAFSGTATDAGGVASASVAVRRAVDRKWLRRNGTWGTFQWLPGQTAAPGASSTSWTFAHHLSDTGGYAMQLRIDDTAGNQNAVKGWVPFRVEERTGDTATPTGTVTSPAAGQAVTNPVTIAGNAADDAGVARVRLGIRNSDSGEWWNGTGWQSGGTRIDATLGAPGGATTSWSYELPSLPNVRFGFSVDVVDTAGKLAVGSGKPAWRTFEVTG